MGRADLADIHEAVIGGRRPGCDDGKPRDADDSLAVELCQTPFDAMRASDSFGPQLWRLYMRARLCLLRTGSTTAQAASTASSRVKSAPSPAIASPKSRS